MAKKTIASGTQQAVTTKLGKWKIVRKDDQTLTITVPKGMVVGTKNPTIEDLLSAIATSQAVAAGRPVIRCCSGNMAIA